MDDNYGFDSVGFGGSLSQLGIQQALRDFSNINVQTYIFCSTTFNDEHRKCIAEIKKGINNNNNPTIMITQSGLHSILVTGGSWNQLPDYQPQVEYMSTMDPFEFTRRDDTIAYFVSYRGTMDGGTLAPIMVVGQHGSAQEELDEFDAWGGTYYSEEEPPDGCDDCPPLEEGQPLSWLHWLAGILKPGKASSVRLERTGTLPITGGRQSVQLPSQSGKKATNRRRPVGPEQLRTHAVRRSVFVPKPHARTPEDVVANMTAGFNQTRLRNLPGWEDLDVLLRDHRITVSSVARVASLGKLPEYWLLTLRADGQPFAQALVDETGWLLSAMRLAPGSPVVEPKSPEWARSIASEMGYSSTEVRRVHMDNNLTADSGSPDYNPFFEITMAGKEPLYLAKDGSVYRLDPNGSGVGIWRDGKRRFSRIR